MYLLISDQIGSRIMRTMEMMRVGGIYHRQYSFAFPVFLASISPIAAGKDASNPRLPAFTAFITASEGTAISDATVLPKISDTI